MFGGKVTLVHYCMCMKCFVPRSQPAFCHFQYGKAGKGLVSFLTCVMDRKNGRKGLIGCGCTRPRMAKRAKVRGKLSHVSSYRKLSYRRGVERVVGLKYVNLPFSVYIILMRKDTRLPLLVHTESNRKLGKA